MISVVLPAMLADKWQAELARFAICTMRMKTDIQFELVIVESGSDVLLEIADTHISSGGLTYTQDFNLGVKQCKGDFIVHTAIDILVGDRWLESLLACFDIPDCGVATLSCTEPGAVIGSKEPANTIIEGMYGPLMMFKRGWLLDEAYPGMHSDSDLVMRVYQAGFRSYRNHATVCHHLDGVTFKATKSPEQRLRLQQQADVLFRARYQNSPLWMAKMILRGGVMYGREHE